MYCRPLISFIIYSAYKLLFILLVSEIDEVIVILIQIHGFSPGLRKSLFNVFQDGICHPKMALVIDDRLKVWDDKDQPRVHVVPAFAPYHAPHAEVWGKCFL